MKITVDAVDNAIITVDVDGVKHIFTRTQFADIPQNAAFEANVFQRIKEITVADKIKKLVGKSKVIEV